LLLTAPLAFLALAAAIASFDWREFVGAGRPARTAAGALIVFICAAVVTTATAESSASAFFGSFFRLEGLVAWLAYAAIFFACFAWTRSGGQAQSLVDAMLLASVVPACYALLQSMDLDFYVVAGSDVSRANGTQGNPVHLAEYLSYLIPLTMARIWLVKGRLPQSLPWLAILILQGAGIWVTQTRGPLLASLAGAAVLAVLGAASTRRRAWFAAVALGFVAVIALLAAINFSAGARSWAQSTQFISRMVLNFGPDAGLSTNLASRSVVARLGIWQAGTDAFIAAPIGRKIFGYGPESAYQHYFPHVPPSVIRAEDFRVAAIFDRLHADCLDVGLNFGIFGWLAYLIFFSAVFLAAARRLFGSVALTSSTTFFAAVLAGAAAGGGLAVAFGLSQAVLPAACLGIGAGWVIILAAISWDSASRPHGEPSALPERAKWVLMAGLVASLIVFWLDAQINIPILTARVISFVVAALVLALASERDESRTADTRRHPPYDGAREWGIAFALVAACASFLPAISVESTSAVIPEFGLRLIPVVALVLVWATLAGVERIGVARGTTWRWAALVFGLPLTYSVCHLLMRVNVGTGYGMEAAEKVALVVAFGPIFVLTTCLLAGFAFNPKGGDRISWPSIAYLQGGAMAANVVLILISAYGIWVAGFADVMVTSMRWAVVREPATAQRLLEGALSLQPAEWQYRRLLVYRHVDAGLAELGPGGIRDGRYDEFKRALDTATSIARDSVRLEPNNPWAVLALAQVLQVRALRMLRDFDRGGGAAAELEADELFRRGQVLFPSQPAVYRNWANLEFDRGLPADGYRLLDAMENLIPDEPDAYIERILMARRLGHVDEIQATIDRAERHLGQKALELVQHVVKSQQQ
jgi:O-antigen ligase